MHKSDLTTALVAIWVVYLGVMGLLTTRPDAFAQVSGWISIVTIALMVFVWYINRQSHADNQTGARSGTTSRFWNQEPRFGSGSRFGSNNPSPPRPGSFGSSTNPPSRFGSSSPFSRGSTSNRPPGGFFRSGEDKKDDDNENPRDSLFNRLSKLSNTDNPFARLDDDDEKARPPSYFFSQRKKDKEDDTTSETRTNQEEEKPIDLPAIFEDAIRDVLKQESDTSDDEPQEDVDDTPDQKSKRQFNISDEIDFDDDDDLYDDDDFYDDDDDDFYVDDDDDDNPNNIPF